MELSLTRAPLRHGSDAVPERPLSTLLSRSSSPRATAGLGQQYVFTLPGPIADIAYQNQAVVYDLLLKTAAETLITIAADPKHLGARIGLTAVLHTWGSTLTHHPHAHIIVPGGGVSPDGERWIACRLGFFLLYPSACP